MKEITAAALDSRHNLILGSLYIFCRILVLSTADFVLKLVSHIIVNKLIDEYVVVGKFLSEYTFFCL